MIILACLEHQRTSTTAPDWQNDRFRRSPSKAGVSEKTRLHICAKAKELGYSPNPLLSAYRQQTSAKMGGARGNIALLSYLWGAGSFAKAGHRYQQLFQGAERRAEQLGFCLDKIDLDRLTNRRLNRLLDARGIQGLIVLPSSHPPGHLSLAWEKYSAVAMGYTVLKPSLNRVCDDHVFGLRTAVRMCRRKGYRRVGLALSSESDRRSNGLWYAEFLRLQQRLPAFARVSPLLISNQEFNSARLAEWTKRECPDVILFHYNTWITEFDQIYRGEKGTIPAVMLSREPNDFWAGIDLDWIRWGSLLVDQLALQLVRGERGIPASPSITLFKGEWVDAPGLPRKCAI